MAFIRQRTTSSGSISTTLIEAYRDGVGKPRQRVLANLHGATTLLEALAKLAVQREGLRAEKVELGPDLKDAADFYEHVTAETLAGHRYSTEERKEIDRLMRARERDLRRARKADATLARIQKDGVAIKKHCEASANEIQAAIRQYEKELNDAELMALGAGFYRDQAKQALRGFTI